MNIRSCLIVGWLVAGLQILSAGQTPAAQDTSGQSSGSTDASVRTAPAAALSGLAGMQAAGDADDAGNDLPRIPAMLGGKGASSAFLSEMERSNYLRGGLNIGATYDDNPLLVSNGPSNTSETIFPNIMIEESTSRMRWSLGYAGGLTVNQKITAENQGSHNLNFDSQYRLSPHVNLRVAEIFSMTTGLFDAGNGNGVVTGGGGPNTGLITPLSTQRSSLTTVETNYHFALNDVVGGSGSFYDLHFSNINQPPAGTPSTQLTDTQTASGSAFWLHRIFRGDWGGASYRFDRITFNPNGETRIHTFSVVNTLNLSNRFTLSGFIGPQYSENQGLASGGPTVQSSTWSVAGGAEGGWHSAHTSLSAAYSRSITDGGGILGAVRLQNVTANLRRELVPGWAVSVNANRGTNHAITVPVAGSPSSINLTSAGVSLERNVGKSIGLRLGYSHDFQEQFGLPVPNPTLDAHRNRFFATLSYQWAKPLGM